MKPNTPNQTAVQTPFNILIVDHHSIYRKGLRSIFEEHERSVVVLEASSILSSLSLIKSTSIDLLMFDSGLPGIDLSNYVKVMRSLCPKLNIIVLGSTFTTALVRQIRYLGARAFLLKTILPDEVIKVFHKVLSGTDFIAYPVKRKHKSAGGDLTARELEILQLLAQDQSSKEIAETLFLSKHTVDNHRKNMLRKTNNRSTVALLAWALNRGHI